MKTMKSIIDQIKPGFISSIGVIIFSFIFLSEVSATHVVGGNLHYRCLGNDIFEISLEFRRDCFNGDPAAQFDDPASIAVYDAGSGDLLLIYGMNGELLPNLSSNDTLNEVLTTECEILGGDVCVHTTIYKSTVKLDYRPNGYVFAYQRCCRNLTLNNIVDPLGTGATYWAFLSGPAYLGCNNQPQFNSWPNIFMCANEEYTFDMSATDEDGDSLVYSLYTPFIGGSSNKPIPTPAAPPPYDNVTWLNPYSLDNLLGGVPLAIDSLTGWITALPNTVGQFLVGVKIEEYRGGQLLSTNYRDFEYNVRICDRSPNAGYIAFPEMNCSGLAINFENTSDTDSIVYYFDYPNLTPSSTLPVLTYTFNAPGLYNVALVAQQDMCIDTFMMNIGVGLPNDTDAAFSISSTSCDEIIELQITNETTSLQEIIEYNWTIIHGQDTIFSQETDPFIVIDNNQDIGIHLEVVTESGCTHEYEEVATLASIDFELLPSPIAICETGSTFLVANSDPSYTYTWDPDGTLDLTDPHNPVSHPLMITTYFVTVTDGVCTITDQVTVELEMEQTVNILGQLSICDGDVILEATAGPGSEFEWFSDPNYLQSLGNDNPITLPLSPNEEMTFYVSLINSLCEGFAEFTVEQNSLDLQLDIVGDVNRCTGDTIMVTLTNNVDDHDLDILWFPSGLVEGQGNDTALYVYDAPGSYIFNVQAFNQFGCNIMTSTGVTIYSYPQLDIIGDATICDNGPVELNPSGDPTLIYSWLPNDPSLIDDPTSYNPIVDNLIDTVTFSVTVTNNDLNLCPTIQEVTLMPAPEINISTNAIYNYCSGDTAFVFVETDVDTDVTWADESGIVVFEGNPLNLIDLPSGTYTVTAVDQFACSETMKVEVGVYSYPEIDLIPNQTICYQGPVELNPDGDPSLNYIWDSVDPSVLDDPTSFNPTVDDLNEVMTFYVTVTSNNLQLCPTLDSVELTPSPDINLVAQSDYTYCKGDTAVIEVAVDVDVDITWILDGNIIVFEGNPLEVFDLDEGNYLVLAEDEFGCLDSAFVNVTHPADINLDVIVDDEQYCEGFESTLTAIADTDVEYTWYDEDGSILGNEAVLDVSAMGEETYIVVAEDAIGCQDTTEVTLSPYMIDFNLSGPELLCEEEEGTASVTVNGSGDFQYIWSPEEPIQSGQNTNEITYIITDDTWIYVTISNEAGCEWIDSLFTVLSIVDPFTVTANPSEINLGETVQLEVTQGEGYTYEWEPSEDLDQDNVFDPIATPEEASVVYTVTVMNADGCFDTASVTVSVTLPNCDESDVYVPNMFSPNDDGLNDDWEIKSNFIDDLQLIVFNRWGEKVFESNSQSNPWDGTFENEMLEPDVYGYHLFVRCINGFEYTTRGNVTIMK